jgi:CYTH domain-containing protein
MPTENERKYVLKMDCEPKAEALSHKKYFISQGYLIATRGITVRIRKLDNGKKVKHYFTLKANAGGRCIELEERIDKRDYDDLWAICLNKLEKIRYVVKDKKDVWELDFFKDYQGQTYFALAEVELPEGVPAPDKLLDIVSRNLLYEVPLTDNRFGNKLLGDARYAADILHNIKSKFADFKDIGKC